MVWLMGSRLGSKPAKLTVPCVRTGGGRKATMEFRILGPIEVRGEGGDRVDLGGERQSTLLAVLLLHANRVVSVERLITALWDDPPRTAEAQIQQRISRLRRVFVDHGLDASRITYQSPGYVLRVEPGELDLALFDELAAEGRRALAAGRADEASGTLHQALDMWHGPVLAGATHSFAERERPRLEERRLKVVDDCLDADLILGRHAELIPELRDLVAHHPLRESFRARLMLALYRTGRKADALEVFRETWRTFGEELGIEPGPELRQLHQEILRDDPRLGIARSASIADQVPGAARPAELPPKLATFTGRCAEIARISSHVMDSFGKSTPIVAIDGPAGVGKSTLANQVGHILAEQFVDGLLYANLHGATPGRRPLRPDDVLARFLRSLGVVDERGLVGSTDELAARFRTYTNGRRILVLLDDAATVDQVRPLVPGGTTSAVLATSRRVLATLDGAIHVHLDPMLEREALDLFGRLLGSRAPAGDDAAAEVVRLCGRLPLAIRIAAARLAARPSWTTSTLAHTLVTARNRLDELEHSDLAVRTSFEASLTSLSEEAIRLFSLLGLVEVDDFTIESIAALTGGTIEQTQDVLDSVVDAQLVEVSRPGRYSLHDLIRLYARDLAGHRPESERTDAVRRLLHHYLATCRRAANLLAPAREPRLEIGPSEDELVVSGRHFEGRGAAIEWADAETNNLVPLVRQAAVDPEHRAVAAALAAVATVLFNVRGPAHHMLRVNEVALEAAAQTADRTALAQVTSDLGFAYLRTGNVPAAEEHLRKALPLWREVGSLTGEAYVLTLMGSTYAQAGDEVRARECFQQALDIRRELGHRDAEAAITVSLGTHLARSGDVDAALQQFEAAHALYEAEGSPGGRGLALGMIGKAYSLKGEPQRAAAYLEQAIAIVRESGQREFEAWFLWYLGHARRALGNTDAALDCWRKALELSVRSGGMTPDQANALLATDPDDLPQEFELLR